MSIAIMQPYFFPYLGYWQLVNYVDVFVIFDDVNYINRGWIDRNRIVVNEKEHYLKLPLYEKSQNKLICDINVKRDGQEIEKLKKTIELAYKRANYYNETIYAIEEMLDIKEVNLAKYLGGIIRRMCTFLDIKTKLLYSSELDLDNKTSKGQDRIISICKYLGANEYINPIGGIMLYDNETFFNNRIKLSFLEMNDIRYKQRSGLMIPGLSIIDVLMNNGKELTKAMLDMYTLKYNV